MSKTIRFLLLFTVLHLCAMSFTGCERQVIISPGTPSPTNSLPNNTEIIDNLLENEIWNEGKWLIEKLGKTAIEIDDSYSEWTFVGCINGWNYFKDEMNNIVYFFSYILSDGTYTESLTGDMVCHGILTDIYTIFPGLASNDENSLYENIEKRMEIELQYNSDGETFYYVSVPSLSLTLTIYPNEDGEITLNSGISLVAAQEHTGAHGDGSFVFWGG